MKNFITFEGCEGAGKSTQIRLINERLMSRGVKSAVTREPGGTGLAEKIRAVILEKGNEIDGKTEFLLYSAARAQHIKEVIAPALADGAVVLCDRYTDSSAAYQGAARGLNMKFIDGINKEVTGRFTPEFTIFLDMEPEAAALRKNPDKLDRMESESAEFHRKVYAGYRAIAKKEPRRFIAVDASGTPEEVNKRVIEVFMKKGILK